MTIRRMWLVVALMVLGSAAFAQAPWIKEFLETINPMSGDAQSGYIQKLSLSQQNELYPVLLAQKDPHLAYLAFQMRLDREEATPAGQALAALIASGKIAELDAEAKAAGQRPGMGWTLVHSPPKVSLVLYQELKRYWSTGTEAQRQNVEQYIGTKDQVEQRLDAAIAQYQKLDDMTGYAFEDHDPADTHTAEERREEQRAATRVSDMHDELLKDPQDRPIGVRLRYSIQLPADTHFEMRFKPRMTPEHYLKDGQALSLEMSHWESDPPMPEHPDKEHPAFRKGQVYRITADMVPMFISTSRSGTCVWMPPSEYVDNFKKLVTSPGSKFRYHIRIFNAGFEGMTENQYDVKAWFDSAVAKELPECPGMCGTKLCDASSATPSR